MRPIQKKGDRGVWHAAILMLRGKPHELISNTAQRIQLKRMVAWPRFEELIKALLEINCRGAGHVIKIVALAIPGQRRSHRSAVTGVKKIVRPGKVLLFRKCRRRIAEVRRMIIKKLASKLPRRSARKCNAHGGHGLYSRSFHSQKSHAPFTQRMRKRGTRS